MGRSIFCSKCKKEKEPGRENESCCKSCKSAARSARNKARREALGLVEYGTGRKLECSKCGSIKEFRDRSYCNKCTNESYNAWYKEKNNLSIYCDCGKPKVSLRRVRCDDCQMQVDQNKYRMDAAKYREKEINRFKDSVRGYTLTQIRNGRLVKQPCEVCGSTRVEAHHDDYEKPLDVRWLCKKHHAEHHRNITEKELIK